MQLNEATKKGPGTKSTVRGLKRGNALKKAFFGVNTGETVNVQIQSNLKTFETKLGETFTYTEVINLDTGEEMNLWTSGGLKHQLEAANVGDKLEITCTGKAPAMVMIDGKQKETEVNQYTVYTLVEDSADFMD